MDYSDSMSAVMGDEGMATVMAVVKGVSFVVLLIGLVGGLFGFKLTKIFMGICAFFVGFGAGIALNLKYDQPIYVLIGLVLGIVLAILSYKFFKVGVFFKTTFDAFPLATILMEFAFLRNYLPKDLTDINAYDNVDPEKLAEAGVYGIIGAVILAIAIGVLAVIFTKPVIISSTSLSFGVVSGASLATLIGNTKLILVLSVVFIAVNFAVQILTNHGFLEKKKEQPAAAAAIAEAVPVQNTAEAPAPVNDAPAAEVNTEAAQPAEEEISAVQEEKVQSAEDNSPEIQ